MARVAEGECESRSETVKVIMTVILIVKVGGKASNSINRSSVKSVFLRRNPEAIRGSRGTERNVEYFVRISYLLPSF
jgi:hypothetical protein